MATINMNYSSVYGQKTTHNIMEELAKVFDFQGEKYMDLYNIRSNTYDTYISSNGRYVVMMACTNREHDEDAEYAKREVCINGERFPNIQLLPTIKNTHPEDKVEHLKDQHGNEIVGVLNGTVFYILVHQDDFYPSSSLIFQTFKLINHYIKERNKPLSYEEQREVIAKQLKEQLLASNESLIREREHDLKGVSREIEDRIYYLKTYYDRQATIMRELDTLRNQETSFAQIMKDLDLIANHPVCTNVSYKNNEFYFDVKDIHCFDSEGNEYYIGDITMKVNLASSIVRFYGKPIEGRHGYWSHQDPHPHVQWSSHEGDNGKACLGSSASIIAELCSQRQLYALYLSLIDFLESVNTDDAAGAKVRNWDRIIDGERVEAEGEDLSESDDHFFCQHCEEYHHYDNSVEVFEDLNEEEQYARNSDTVCDNCATEHYEYFDEIEAYLPSDCYQEVYGGRVVHVDNITTGYLRYNHSNGPYEEVEIDTSSAQFYYWESIDEYIHENYREDDYFNSDFNKVDAAGNRIDDDGNLIEDEEEEE